MPSSILQKTTNFFQLYRYICGDSEVPDVYHFWASVALIAATVEDRVFYQHYKHEKLYPNLFIMLVGPSGLGKGQAISQVVRLAEHSITINKYRGRVTSPHLIDYLGKPTIDEFGQKHLANPRLWLIMDELQNDVGNNRRMTEDFIYLLTELYTASGYTVNTGTRTHGQVDIENPLLNWLVGTTEGSLRKLLTKDNLSEGFTARTCFIFGVYDYSKRISRVKYPADYEEIFHHLCCRLWLMQRLCGEMKMTVSAEAEMDKWYKTRPAPEEELMAPVWQRQQAFLFKFAMILSLADGGPLVIRRQHIIRAKAMVTKITQFYEVLVEAASETKETKPENILLDYIKKKGQVEHTPASRYFRKVHGMNSKAFRDVVNTLAFEGYIVKARTETGAALYLYKNVD